MEKDMQLSSLDASERLRRLPDRAELTTSEAAIFLRASPTTVEALIASAPGLAREQTSQCIAADRLRDPVFGKADLLAWHRREGAASAAEAPVRKGRLFASIVDLTEPAAFWLDQAGAVVGMVEAALASTAVDRVGQFNIEWLAPLDAGAREWASLTEHQSFVRHAASALHGELSRLSAGLARTAVATEPAAPTAQSAEGEA